MTILFCFSKVVSGKRHHEPKKYTTKNEIAYTAVPCYPPFQLPVINCGPKQMILLLTYCQVNSRLTLCHNAYVIHLTSCHHIHILSSHITTSVSTVQY